MATIVEKVSDPAVLITDTSPGNCRNGMFWLAPTTGILKMFANGAWTEVTGNVVLSSDGGNLFKLVVDDDGKLGTETL